MAKSDLLKEAIADAKAIKETALANARIRMEEAFTPRLQSMISSKLQNEIEGEGEDEEVEDLDAVSEPELEEPVDTEAPVEEPVDTEAPVEEPVDTEAPAEAPVEEPVDTEAPVEVDDEDSVEVEPEINSDEDVEEEGMDSLDLESIIRELEQEADVDDSMEEPSFEDEPVSESEDEDEEKEELDEESDKLSKKATDVTPTLTGDKGPNAGGGEQVSPDKGKPFSTETGGEGKVSTDLKQNSKNAIYEEDGSDEEDEINLEEILKELQEEEMSDSIPDESNTFKAANAELSERVSKLSKELKEHRNVIKFLKSKLNEVNLLNAKLLFTSKLFKSNNMNNTQKMKVIESFDRAKSLREVKLVYTTIAESFGDSVQKVVKTAVKKDIKKISEAINSGASKVIASTKPTKVIKESIVDEESSIRLKYLAGIKPKKEIKK